MTCCIATALDILHLKTLDLESPNRGGTGDAFAEKLIDPVAFLQDFIEIVLADDVSQTRQRQFVDGCVESAISMTDFAASTIRYHSTALTLIVTLSA